MALSQYPFKGGVPTGQTANRPSSPSIGDVFYNGTLGLLEIYTSIGWQPCSSPPASPTSVTATDASSGDAYTSTSAGKITVSFSAGVGGGLPTNYIAYTTSGGFSSSGTSSPITITGLTLGTSYTTYVVAQNGYGNSPVSANAAAVTPTTKPQAPTIGTASTSSVTTDVTVTWTLGNNGSSNLTSITITPYLNGTTAQTARTAATTSSTSYVFTGASALTAGSSYTFKVKVTNANGDSPESSATNSITIPVFFTMDYLVVSGGGGGSGNIGGGGGGGGGFTSGVSVSYITGTYSLKVGAGGSGGNGTGGGTGVTSKFDTAEPGAGLGGNYINNNQGKGGTSGSPQSKTGGNGAPGSYSERGGGGGGAGANGSDAQSSTGGPGGDGLTSSITGSSVYYAGGGGGGGARDRVSGAGGLGGGGGGGTYPVNGNPGSANTGGGGGAANPYTGGNGGSGVVILKIPSARTVTFSGGVTQTNTTSGSNKIYTITAAGTSDTVTIA